MADGHGFPHGREILNPNCPEARWDVSGLFEHDMKFFQLVEASKRLFGCDLPIESVHGCHCIMWNSGRVYPYQMRYRSMGDEELDGFPGLLKKYNDAGISVYYTFSNPLIQEEHLDDPSGNYLLEVLAKQNVAEGPCSKANGVIVSSDALSSYIRNRFPQLKQKASIIKADCEMPNKKGGRSPEYYEELAERFDRVMIAPDDNFDECMLERLSRNADKYEVLVNETCTRGCVTRDSHYKDGAEFSLSNWNGIFHFGDYRRQLHAKYDHRDGICPEKKYGHPDPSKRTTTRSCALGQSELKAIYDMGFRHFKIQARGGTPSTRGAAEGSGWKYSGFETMRYMLEPDQIFPKWAAKFILSPEPQSVSSW